MLFSRPNTLSDVSYQEDVIKSLQDVLMTGNVLNQLTKYHSCRIFYSTVRLGQVKRQR